MKRWIALVLLLLLTACSPPTHQEETAPPASLPQEEVLPQPVLPQEEALPQPVLPQEQVIRYQADTTLFADTLYAEDGTQLLHYAVRVPYLTAWRADDTEITEAQSQQEEQALAAVQTFNERFTVWYSDEVIHESFNAVAEDLKWYREENLDWYGGHQMELDCDIYQTDHLVSVSGVYYAYTGGAHPNTYLLGWTFDLENGTFFEAQMLAGNTELKEAITQELIRQAEKRAGEMDLPAGELYWPEYQEILADWSSYAVSLDEDGMNIAFSPYELAAYAAGIQEFSVTYDWLSQYLDEDSKAVLGIN